MRRTGWLSIGAAAVFCLLAAIPSYAQLGGRGGGRQRQFRFNPAMIQNRMRMMQNAMPQQGPLRLDPARTNESSLLRRNDVRHELLLSGEQQDKITKAILAGQQQLSQQIATTMQDRFAQMRQNRQGFGAMSPQERQAYFQQMREQTQQKINDDVSSQDKVLEQSLTPGQIARLHQLDLQWRTPMALVDSKLADKFAINRDQLSEIKKVEEAFIQQQHTDMRSAFQPPPAPVGSDPNANAAAPLTPQQRMAQTADLMKQADQSLYKVRNDDANNAYHALTPEQKQQWLQMVGKLFYFNPKTEDEVQLSQQGQQ